MTQFFTAHQVDQRISSAQQGLTTETYGDQVRNFAVREASHLLGLRDNRTEVVAFEVAHTRPADDAAGPDTVVVRAHGWVDDAVRGHHDWAREASEFHLLVLPAAAVVTDQVFELTQFRVAVRWQHFTVGIDVNAGAFGLFQQVVEIFQVVTGDQDALTFSGFHVDLSRGRVAVFGGFAGIQNAHHFEVHLADFHRALQQSVHIGRPGAQPRHDFVVLRVDVVVVLAENVGMFHVSCRTFQAVQTQQAQAENVLTDGGFVFVRGKFRRLFLQIAQIVTDQLQVSHRVIDGGVSVFGQALRFQRFTQGNRFTGVAHDTRRVEVNVGQSGEKCTRGKVINIVVDDAVFTRLHRPCGQTLQRRNQQILQIGRFSRLTTHTLSVRAAVPCRSTDGLFTLHTKHGSHLFKVIFNIHV